MSAKLKSVIFIVVLCVVCSLILTFGATALKAPQERNALLDRQVNILRAAGIMPAGKVAPAELQTLYNERVREFFVGIDSTISLTPDPDHLLQIFTVFGADGQDVEQVILPFTVKGVWGPISGYLALHTDLDSVAGFTVYDHNETAGLGAEIAGDWFQNQWRGKKLHDAEGYLRGVLIAKGASSPETPFAANTVDGISGATSTGKALSQNLLQKLKADLPLLQKINWASIKR